jgi:histidinol-phosphate aminotransferase
MAQPVLTDLLNRVRQPFNVNSLAQAAAIAALNDKEFLTKSFAVNRDGKEQLQKAFETLGLQFVPSYANFVLVKVGDAARINRDRSSRRGRWLARMVACFDRSATRESDFSGCFDSDTENGALK